MEWNTNSSSYALVTEERYWYDGWNIIGRADSATALVQNFVWGLDLSGTMQGAGGVGGLLMLDDSQGASYFYGYDGNGNVLGLVNANTGTVAAQYDYDPFLGVIRASGLMAKVNPFLGSTKFYDWTTELYNYGYRIYKPATGTWLNRDSIGERGGKNIYEFARNNALRFVDSLGHDVYVVYRPLNITGLGLLFPLAGHVYLAFNDDNMGNDWRTLEQNLGFGPGWHTFSFHPENVVTEQSDTLRVSVEYTTSQAIKVDDADQDVRDILNGAAMRLPVTTDPCLQTKIFQRAYESMQLAGSDFGPYSFSENDCGTWAKGVIQYAGGEWPAAAYGLNLGTGVNGPLDYTGLPQATYYGSVVGYNIYNTGRNAINWAQQNSEPVLIPLDAPTLSHDNQPGGFGFGLRFTFP
jgi:RHS repeat-associated protein